MEVSTSETDSFECPSDRQSLLQTSSHDTHKEQNPEPAKETEPWYMSPLFDQPVIGYYNRFSQSEPALDYPFRQSATAYHGRPGQFGSTYDGPFGYGQTDKPDRNKQQDTYSEIAPPTVQNILDQTYISKPVSASPHTYPGVSDNHNFPTLASAYSLAASNDMLTSQSRDQPEPLKPEEYLSGLQADVYSVKYSQAPCGRCTRAVTVIIVVMSLAIIALAAALTTSVLMRKAESGDGEELADGYPVVRAFMDLKILNKNFTESMADRTSTDFYNIARPYSKELDRLFLTSPLKEAYLGNRILSLQPGSIKTRAELLFLGDNAVDDGKDVENVIDSAQRAEEWKESDARDLGEFVVCGDCVKVSLNFTRIPRLPKRPVLEEEGSAITTNAPDTDTNMTSTTTAVVVTSVANGATTAPTGDTTTLTETKISVTNTTPFLEDGHFIVACDITNPGNWMTLTIGIIPDNASVSHMAVLVTLTRGDLDPVVSSKYQSRVFAYADLTSPNGVGVVMNVTQVTCADRGDYVCRLSLHGGRQYSSKGRVDLQELPSMPVIKETKNSTQWDATPVYVCSAKLGHPPGQMTLSVVRGENETLERVTADVRYQGEGCEATAELRISLLDSRLLGNPSRVLCQVFSDHLKLLDQTEYSTFRQVALPHKLEIKVKSAPINEGLAAIRCRILNIQNWQRLTLLRKTSDEFTELVSALPDGSLDWNDFYLRHRSMSHVHVSVNHADLDIFIFSLKCTDEGVYSCGVRNGINVTWPEAYFEVTASPSSPSLTMPMGAVENSLSQSPIVCHAKVGRPAGTLILKVRNQNEVHFRELAFNERTTTPFSCTTEMRGTFYPTDTAVSNGSTVSCQVIPHESVRKVHVDLNVSDTFFIIPGDHCKNQGEKNLSHPTSCRHYVTCENDTVVNTTECDVGFCFDSQTGTCSAKAPKIDTIEKEPGPCYPDKDYVSIAHRHLCHVFHQCHSGVDLLQHCPTGTIYASNLACTTAVKESQCYKDLDTSYGVSSNTTQVLT